MEATMWILDRLEINGGFLPGLKLTLPRGLICIIGPRGSGKSTLAEALRFAIKGTTGASRQRLDLLQANIGNSGLVTLVAKTDADATYTIRRGYKQAAVLISADGRMVPNVDLDRGSFLPLDAYNGPEIEAIADEALGERRRALLDDLRSDQLSTIHLSLGEHRRALEANADRIRATRRTINDISERIEEIGDARAKLNALGPAPESAASTEYTKTSRQQQCNSRELRRIDEALAALSSLHRDAMSMNARFADAKPFRIVEETSANSGFLEKKQTELQQFLGQLSSQMQLVIAGLENSKAFMDHAKSELNEIHAKQAVAFTEQQQMHREADERYRVRLDLEQSVVKLQEVEAEQSVRKEELIRLLEDRKALKARFLLGREQISGLREAVATELQREIGKKVRIRVMRNADDLAYRTLLTEGLKGARVRNHDEILESLLQLRPEQLAQFIHTDDHVAFDEACGFGTERTRKILDAFRENVDPLELEVVEIEDQVRIELNVATINEPIFKDAAELSRGQKCTALLPLLLARTTNPLIIDQPEDNLDNHFIYETVVNSIQRLKGKRQMIFITHNANIPVLADADLVIVMNSDGKIGYIEKSGSVDECRDHIVDLLEGGKKAFEMRRERYARA
jgi:energy-coupling factor transporter ATP-binding protein EcfA2